MLAAIFPVLLPPASPALAKQVSKVIMAEQTKRAVDAICPHPGDRDRTAAPIAAAMRGGTVAEVVSIRQKPRR